MINELRPYPEYRDSGLPWLGQVPKHWKLTTMRRVTNVQLSNVDKHTIAGEHPIRLCNYTDVYYHRYITPHMNFMKATALPREIDKFELRRGDVLITKDSEDWKDIAVPSLVTTDMLGVLCGYHLAHIRPEHRDLRGDYLMWALRSEPVAFQFRVSANGVTRYAVSIPDIKGSILPLPLIDEQLAIGWFLRKFEYNFSRFIRNRRRLIEVLNEQKQAIINQAVTRGLDPNTPLKPSGIDWLGDIPEHWVHVRLKQVARVQTGITLGKNYQGQPMEARPYLRVANVQAGRLDLRTVKTVKLPPCEVAGRELVAGDVLMTEGGDIDKLGRGCVWRGEIVGCLHQNHVFAVRVNRTRIIPDYLAVLMASQHGRIYFEMTAKRTTNLASTNSTTLGAFPLVLPGIDEQHALLDNINEDTKELNALLGRAEAEIDLICEYRTRLISDVVTGKVDVRHLAPPPDSEDLADMAEALEPLEEDIAENMIDGEEPTCESD